MNRLFLNNEYLFCLHIGIGGLANVVIPVIFLELQHRILSTDTHTQKNGCIGLALWAGACELCVGWRQI